MNRLHRIDLGASIDEAAYIRHHERLQKQLILLQRDLFRMRMPLIIVFEGWDAAGKGGAIRQLVKNLDPRGYQVYAVSKPSDEELSHHYMRRFWIQLPARGRISIFDRSWYGRVLVERVEGFATKAEWSRAYDEINTFEQQLIISGCPIIKFFMHIGKDEQKRRFKARAADPLKFWKLTDEDRRNRRRWDDYSVAFEAMFERTDTHAAPWHIIPANNKHHARKLVQEICVAQLTRFLAAHQRKRRPPSV